MPSTSTRVKECQERFAYNNKNLLEYQGWAEPGLSTSEPVWLIVKYNYNNKNLLVSITFAKGNNNFDKVWDNRESYTYS